MDRRKFLFGSLAGALLVGCDSTPPPGIAPAPATPPKSPDADKPPPAGRTSRANTSGGEAPKLKDN
jgi:hypothetical protein